jgi:hypothetical protein
MGPIPAVWRIDVEPDEFPLPSSPGSWSGFVTMSELVRELRPRLADRSGIVGHPTWFFRFDPEIARAYGRTDFVVDRYQGLVDELRAHGDPLGIHIHYYRWNDRKQVVYSEHADVGWINHCFDVAAHTFERCFGEPVRRSSQGGYFLHDAVVDRAVAVGVEVDVTAEPGLGARTKDATFGAYVTAPSPDFRGFPRRPYYPSTITVGTPANSWETTRRILIVPLTAYDYQTSGYRRLAQTVMRRPRHYLPLNPFKGWSHPRIYWDLVARAADEGPACYVAFAVRTDGADSESHHRVRALLEYLPNHPIAERLRFVDPLSPSIRALADAGID